MTEADRSKNDQCPRCGRLALTWDADTESCSCLTPGCGFACELASLPDRQRTRRELEGRACRDIHSSDLWKFTESGGLPRVGAVGYASHDGFLHIYEDAEDFRARIGSRRFGQIGWISGVRWHAKGGEGRSAMLEDQADG
jgi:hypothetical protein